MAGKSGTHELTEDKQFLNKKYQDRKYRETESNKKQENVGKHM